MKNTKFKFQGIDYDYLSLKDFALVKTFTESSHFDRKLIKDEKNDVLYLYEFYEWEDWNDGNDEIYTTYTVVKDEKDAILLNEKRYIRRQPYFMIQPNYDVLIREGLTEKSHG